MLLGGKAAGRAAQIINRPHLPRLTKEAAPGEIVGDVERFAGKRIPPAEVGRTVREAEAASREVSKAAGSELYRTV